jgi:hypothetical protein
MLVSTVIFIGLTFFVKPYGLAGLIAVFTLYLGLRGLTLLVLMPRVYRQAGGHA